MIIVMFYKAFVTFKRVIAYKVSHPPKNRHINSDL